MSTSSVIRVRPVGGHPTVIYAAEELARCLSRISGREAVVEPASSLARETGGLWLGTAADITDSDCPAVSHAHDDAVAISVSTEPSGTIVGANARSVLLAVYRYLNHLGCRWVRPGPDGELLPSGVRDLSCSLAEKPAYRHRGMCIEGAVSEQHVRNMIEWLPRVGMNAYFTQFRESFTFFDRWYTHSSGSHDRCEPFTREEAKDILRRLVDDIRKRSLLYHAVGHGWTCDPFGMPGLGWEFEPVKATPEVEPYLALVNGKREVWGGVPLNTNLCYSNPTVRRIMVEDMLSYVTEHPEIDLLHVWLADGANNQCECEACAAARPSDFYVMLLNELDAALTAAHLPVRVVFLIYVDLLWPPERERIANPDRFVLMFAPITRSYSRSLQPVARDAVGALPPYTRNHLQFPKSVEENVAFLRAWETAFRGDSFDFDYHMMWDHYNDPGHCRAAAVLHEDVRQLAAIGLNGLVSCQTQRAAFPTGLMLCAMAQALWNPAVRFSAVEEDHFRSAFGPDWQKARSYLCELSELFDPEYVRGDRPSASQTSANVRCDRQPGFARIPDVIADFRPVIEHNMNLDQPVWAASWRYLNHHADICVPLARAYAAREMGDREEAQRMWKAAESLAWEREAEIGNVLDVYLFTNTLSSRFRP
jgi:hypothetical protein